MEGYILWAVPTSAGPPILYGRIRPMAEELPKGADRYIARGCGIGTGTYKPVRRGHTGSWYLPSPMSLVSVEGQPLTDRLALLGGSLLPQPYDLSNEGHVFDNAGLAGCLTHAGELSGLHPLQDVWSVSGYPGDQVITPVACLGFLVKLFGLPPPRTCQLPTIFSLEPLGVS